MKLLPAFLLCLLSAAAALAGQATVARVVDGDSGFLLGGQGYRLKGIDAPERGQPCSAEATAFVRSAIEGKRVRVDVDGQGGLYDHYGRLLVYIYLRDGRCLNEELLRLGLARATTRYPCSRARAFLELEQEARKGGKGMWHEESRVPSPGHDPPGRRPPARLTRSTQ